MKVYPHGTDNRYVLNKCRCTTCRAAHTAEARRRRRLIAYGRWGGYVNAVGTIRRIRALAVAGWSCEHIAKEMNVDPSVIREIARGERKRVHHDTACTVAAVYNRWCTEDGPSRHSPSRARRKGWSGPEAWTDDTIDDPDADPLSMLSPEYVDEVAVQRVVEGHARISQLHGQTERVAAVAALAERGMTASQIARRVGTGHETVQSLLNSTDGQQAA